MCLCAVLHVPLPRGLGSPCRGRERSPIGRPVGLAAGAPGWGAGQSTRGGESVTDAAFQPAPVTGWKPRLKTLYRPRSPLTPSPHLHSSEPALRRALERAPCEGIVARSTLDLDQRLRGAWVAASPEPERQGALGGPPCIPPWVTARPVSRPRLEGPDACRAVSRRCRQLKVAGKCRRGQCQDRSWRAPTPAGLWTGQDQVGQACGECPLGGHYIHPWATAMQALRLGTYTTAGCPHLGERDGYLRRCVPEL